MSELGFTLQWLPNFAQLSHQKIVPQNYIDSTEENLSYLIPGKIIFTSLLLHEFPIESLLAAIVAIL